MPSIIKFAIHTRKMVEELDSVIELMQEKVNEAKKVKSEYSMMIGMGVCLMVFLFLMTKIQVVLLFVERLEALAVIDSSYIAVILKMIGIAYVAEFAIDVCKDAGYSAIGSQIETFAKISILVVSLPILLTFLETMGDIL